MRHRGVTGVVATAALVVAACGGGDHADDGAPTSDSELTFTATTTGGQKFDADSLTGDPALFWFWAPWCSTCVAEAPHVLDIAEQHEGQMAVVGVASLGGTDEMADFIALTGTSDLVHLDDEEGDVWRHFGITEQSSFAVVDDTGAVTYSGFLSPEELADEVAAVVG